MLWVRQDQAPEGGCKKSGHRMHLLLHRIALVMRSGRVQARQSVLGWR